ncbi:MAG: glutamate--tRNA ligase [Candidatus Margulisiibacteriota bacterium]
MIRVRFAPSPTGSLHVGTLRTALFNWIFAKHVGAASVLRIEDTDLARSDVAFEQTIFDGLSWLGLNMDEGPVTGGKFGPYRQSERAELYHQHAHKLLASGHAYWCFCSDADLDAERATAETNKVPYVYSRKCLGLNAADIEAKKAAGIPHTLRFKVPNGEISFPDIIRGDITFDMNLVSDFVLIKSDQTPSYNFAVVVDDWTMAITHIIRGEDHISNTPKQIALYQAFGAPVPKFAHLPMILGPDKSKLSKRHGATSVTDYRDMGYLPEAFFNYLVLLGWSSADGRELLSRDEIVQAFALERISKSGAVFDITKLKWMNGQYVRQLDAPALFAAVNPFVSAENQAALAHYTAAQRQAIFASVQDNLELLADINAHLASYTHTFDSFKTAVQALAFDESDSKVLALFAEKIAALPVVNHADIDPVLADILAATGLGKGKVFRPIRLAVTAEKSGPHLPDIMAILGKDEILRRLAVVLG